MSSATSSASCALLVACVMTFGAATASASTNWSGVSAGGSHTCGVTSAGAALCWGSDGWGEVGNPTIGLLNGSGQVAPVPVNGLSSGVTSISAGRDHTCAIVGGSAKCWGSDQYGQIGDGSSTPTSQIRQVQGLTANVTRIVATDGFTCAIVGGGVKCWGQNFNGQLGDGTKTQSDAPVQATGLTSGVTDVAAVANTTCAVVSSGVECWGQGSIVHSSTPASVTGLTSGVAQVAVGGARSCALLTTGTVRCWSEFVSPTDVSGLGGTAVSLSGTDRSGRDDFCAVLSSGAVKCWGDNQYGQLGNGTYTDSATPVAVHGLTSGVVAVTMGVGGSHACALLTTGGLKCWGYNNNGEIGDGTRGESLVPIQAGGLTTDVTSLSIGRDRTCAVVAGAARCVGWNTNGSYNTGYFRAPTTITGAASGITAVSAGEGSACAVTTAGNAKCWGDNYAGQLGDGSTTDSGSAVQPQGLSTGVTQTSVGDNFACAVVSSAAKCWGDNASGQLGTGDTENSNAPVQVSGLTTGVESISAGMNYYGGPSHTCAVVSGGARCWGSNIDGELGNDDYSSYETVPVDVTGLTAGVSKVSAGMSHTCAVLAGGSAECWGANWAGQLGNGTTDDSSVPSPVEGLETGVTDISAGGGFTCAVINAAAKCWGQNWSGQLGNGGYHDSDVPVHVEGLTSSVVAVAAAEDHACARLVDQSVVCWGSDYYHSTSNPNLWKTTPVDVSEPRDVLFAATTSPAAGGIVHTATPSIDFSTSNAVGVITECSIDGGHYFLCTSPVATPTLADGYHSFDVTAIDAGGNIYQNAGISFTVDTTPDTTAPSIFITSPGDGDVLTAATASVDFEVYDESNFDVTCQLDSQPAVSCTSPWSVTGLTNGNHVVGMVATDEFGNTSNTQASFSVTLASVPPASSLSSPPSQPPATAPPSIGKLPKLARSSKPIAIPVSCESACTVYLTLKLGKKKVKLPSVKVPAGTTTGAPLKVKLSAKAKKMIKKALKKKQKVSLLIQAVSSSGASIPVTVRLK